MKFNAKNKYLLFYLKRKTKSLLNKMVLETLISVGLDRARELIAWNSGLQLDDIAAFQSEIAMIVNSDSAELALLGIAQGADVYSALHVANPAYALLVDSLPVSEDPYTAVIKPRATKVARRFGEEGFMEDYLQHVFSRGFAISDPDEIQKNLLPFIAANLMLAGVDLNSCGNIQIMRLQSKGKLYI